MQKLYKKINNSLIVLLLIMNVLTPPLSVFATDTDTGASVVETLEASEVPSTEEAQVTEQAIPTNEEGEEETATVDSESLEEISSEVTSNEEAETKEEIYFSPVDPSAYITNVTLSHTSGETANGGEIGYHDNFNLSYAFSFPNGLTINNGDTLTLNIPNEMRLLRDDNFPITKDGSPIGVAQVNVASKTIVVTFNDYFQNNPNDKGMKLTIGTAWDTTVLGGGESLNLSFNGKIVSINVGTKPQIGTTEVLQKWGSPDKSNTNRYNWFMRVNNARRQLNSVEIIDTLGEGQEIDVNSINVEFLDSYDPWKPYTGQAPTPVWVEKTTKGFKLTFDRLDAVVSINYQVVITNNNLSKFENSVELKASGQSINNISRTVENQTGSGSGSGTGIKPTPKIGFEVLKELTGRNLEDGEFEFTLTKHRDTGDEVVGRAHNTGNKVIFEGFPYYHAGTYRYTVEEVKGNLPDVIYSEEKIEITVNVVNNNGQLEATVVYPADKTFNNIYSPTKPAKPVIRATIQSAACVVGNIEVELVNDQNVVVEAKTVPANGDVEFTLPDELAPSNKTYKLRQKNVSDTPTINYDEEEKSVTVTVAKSPTENKFVATVNPEKVVFNNECKDPTPTNAVVKARVAANGCTVAPIEVELLEENGTTVVEVATTNQAGEVTFKALPQNAVGTKTYKVRQKVAADTAHIAYDREVKTVTINVRKDDAKNTLVATVNPETVVFNNECKDPTPTNATIKATVKAEGCVVGPVKVDLLDDKGGVIATETANDKGEVSFNVPNLKEAKTYNYKLRQKDVVDTPHVRYDKAEKPVEIKVTLNNQTNRFEATTPETVVFNNECLPATPTNATIKATVKAEGCVVGPVKVDLLDDKGGVIATETANDKGEVSFNVPNLKEAKTYNYKLRQKDVVDTPHVRYDKAEKPVEIKVTLNNQTNRFEATTPETVVFNNECLPATPTNATIKATVKAEGCVVGPVKVDLLDDKGGVIATETANDKGEVSFTVSDLKEAKTYNYKLRQKDVVDTPHVRYDKAEKPVEIKVTLNNQTNRFEATTPETVVFNNECLPATPTNATIKATVKAEGCIVGDVKVELVDSDNKVVGEQTMNKDGEVSFTVSDLKEAKTYNYKLRQKDVVDTPHVRYDKAEKPVEIKVTLNNQTNRFEATTPETVVFNNECLPATPTNATIKATVKAEGCVVGPVKVDLLDDKGGVIATETANDKGEVSFTVSDLKEAKTYNYKLRQKDVVDTPHVRYDKAEKPVEIKVTLNNQTNRFEATTPATVVFNNECLPATPTNATIKATVKAEGCVVGPVKVDLLDDKGGVIATETANDKGEVSFTVSDLKEAKTYNYKLRQKDVVDTPHVRYDKAEKPVEIKVTLNNQTNRFEATTPATVVFNNECLPATPADATIEATIQSEGCVVGPIKVELVDKEGKVIQTKEAEPNGKVTFDVIPYEATGEHMYTIRQVAQDTPFVTYDKVSKPVKVSVTKDEKANKLQVTVSETPVFMNTCIQPTLATIELEAKVTHQGCEVAPEATNFELVHDGKVIQTATSKDGKVMFTVEHATPSKVTYQIRQVPGKQANVVYDKKVVTVTVDTVNTDKNVLTSTATYENTPAFVNECAGKELPKTGEWNTGFILPVALFAMVGAVAVLTFKKKEN